MAGVLKKVWGVMMSLGALTAKDLGVRGTTYPVIEESLLTHITAQLSALPEERLHHQQLEIQARIKERAEAPRPVPGIQTATIPRTFTVDPSITLTQDIVDAQGRVIAAKGRRYNPLAHVTLKEQLLVLDGTDLDQVAWARRQGEATKWVLVKGRPFDLQQAEGRRVYFDQGGAMCRQFQIQYVPARIRQDGQVLRVDEGLEEGDPHAITD